jgi:hypothetical protein
VHDTRKHSQLRPPGGCRSVDDLATWNDAWFTAASVAIGSVFVRFPAALVVRMYSQVRAAGFEEFAVLLRGVAPNVLRATAEGRAWVLSGY